jgi:hypothetical protein
MMIARPLSAMMKMMAAGGVGMMGCDVEEQ